MAGFLDGPRARAAFLLRCVLDPPWSILIQDEAPLTLVAVTEGHAWFVPAAGATAVRLDAGDVLIARGPDPYVVADSPGTAPSIVIDPGELCRTIDGATLREEMHLGVRTWGNSTAGETVMLVGTYLTDGQVSRVLLDALPPAIVVRATDWEGTLVRVLADEITRDEPGQQVVLDRLLDLLLVGALRVAFTGDAAAVPAWYRAAADPTIGQAIRLMQNDPSRPWTVAAIAREVGVSRALLARRFHDLVGEPPMAYLTGWRMALAADLLLEPEATVTSIAATVGYSSPFTFSTAFKRHHGRSPRFYRDERRRA